MASAPPGSARSNEYGHLTPLMDELDALPPGHPRRDELRDRLVSGYLPVAQHVARRFARRGEPVEDLEQAGTIGLIGAVDRFDPGRGIDFLSFAVPTITGEIRRHFRDHTWAMRVPRRLKDIQATLSSVVGPLSQELGRAPRPSEIAHRLGIPVEDVIEGLDAQNAYRNNSLDEPGATGQIALADRMGALDAALDEVECREVLAPLLDSLPERDRTIILLRFFGNQTQTQIAEAVGISQMHVSRLLDRILSTLRRQLTDD